MRRFVIGLILMLCLVGTSFGGDCAGGEYKYQATIPYICTIDGFWTGIAVTNPNDTDTFVRIDYVDLQNGEGCLYPARRVTTFIPPNFGVCYAYIRSTCPVFATVVIGSADGFTSYVIETK